MHIPFVGGLVILPCSALEQTVPVVRGALFALSGAPIVIVAVGIILALAAFLEPLVFVGRVVDDKIHENTHAALMRSVEHLLEYLKVAEIGVNVFVVGYIVAVVCVWRGVQRREPYAVNVQRGNVIELRQNTPQVANAVAVAVAEAAAPYLIHRHFLIPAFLFHVVSPNQNIFEIILSHDICRCNRIIFSRRSGENN